MKKLYYGIWGNLYELNWPLRFFIECFVIVVLIAIIFKIINKLLSALGLKVFIVKIIVFIVKEVCYFFGKNKDWVIKTDTKISAWGNQQLSKEVQDKTTKHIGIIFVGISIIYILAIFEDIPISHILNQYYVNEIGGVKLFFLEVEKNLSNGYNEYPPLLVVFEKKASEPSKAEEIETSMDKEDTYIYLNEKGKNGSNIRDMPSLEGNIVDTVDESSQIIYNGKVQYDGERYWINVTVINKEIGGWISGKLIDEDQLTEIIK